MHVKVGPTLHVLYRYGTTHQNLVAVPGTMYRTKTLPTKIPTKGPREEFVKLPLSAPNH